MIKDDATVVDYLFNGKDTTPYTFFSRENLVKVEKGPDAAKYAESECKSRPQS